MPVESFDTVDIEVLSFDEPESPRRTSVSNEKTTRNKAEVTCLKYANLYSLRKF